MGWPMPKFSAMPPRLLLLLLNGIRADGTELAFDGLFFVFSLMLLPGLWHIRDCLVEKQPAVKSLVFA